MTYLVNYEDERLDTVVLNHYGNLDNLEMVLNDNPHITKDIFLNVGDKIELLEYNKPIIGVRLWD